MKRLGMAFSIAVAALCVVVSLDGLALNPEHFQYVSVGTP